MTNDADLKIVVEGPNDARIIRAIVGKELGARLRIFAGEGNVSLATVGRNVLVVEGGPILLVMDSLTLDPRLTAERRLMNMAALRAVGTAGGLVQPFPESSPKPLNVFAFVPEIEVVFFEVPQSLEHVLGKKIPLEKVREGQLAPKETLAELLENAAAPRDCQALLAGMDSQVRHALASGRQAKALTAMIESMLAVPAKT